MRTRYAIIGTDQALEAGLDPSILRAAGEDKVIVTEAQAENIKDAELLGRDEVNNIMNKKSK